MLLKKIKESGLWHSGLRSQPLCLGGVVGSIPGRVHRFSFLYGKLIRLRTGSRRWRGARCRRYGAPYELLRTFGLVLCDPHASHQCTLCVCEYYQSVPVCGGLLWALPGGFPTSGFNSTWLASSRGGDIALSPLVLAQSSNDTFG